MVFGPDDMGMRVNVGGKWTLLRHECRAPIIQLHRSGLGRQNLRVPLAAEMAEVAEIGGVKNGSLGLSRRDEMHVIVNTAATNAPFPGPNVALRRYPRR